MRTSRGAGPILTAVRALLALLAGCGGTEWEDSDVAVLTLALPDTVQAGQPIPARVTGVYGCTCRLDEIVVTRDDKGWVLEPRSRCPRHPNRIMACDRFFDGVVTLPGQDPGVVRVRTVAYGDDLADSVVVVGR